MVDVNAVLKEKVTGKNYDKLMALANPKLHKFVADAIGLCQPDSVFVMTDSAEDAAYIRKQAVELSEEKQLAIEGHTVHFDGYYDQGRDPGATKYLLRPGVNLGERISSIDRDNGLAEVRGYLSGLMSGRQMLVCFWCLGPVNSVFSIPCVQITDSPYVAHSESILYRPGYEQFKSIGGSEDFFRFLHSEGELENFVSKNVEKRRVYIDLDNETVYSVNTQYGGNTIGLKKLALRLAINKADKKGWLAEHMFVMGVHGPGGRVTYFTGAFPSACGKTSTSMLPGQTIVGDDIAYLRKIDRGLRCVNVEQGIFGIIQDVNPDDDPVIYEAITTPGEVIFGNVLVTDDGKPHWLGMGCELPKEGTNYAGKYTEGMTGPDGKEVTPSHKNARYTVRIGDLVNKDPMMDEPNGVPVGGILYGGRDSDIWVPVEEAYNWTEGIIIKGASIESETTAAAIGVVGVRKFDLMSNLSFVSIPLGRYIENNLNFANGVKKPPKIFSVNYFLRDENGKYLNGMADKLVWVLWAEMRVNGDVEGVETPTGSIPKYEDIAKLFKDKLKKDYTQADYVKEFTIRVPENLAKLDRVEEIYKTKVDDTPKILFDTFNEVRRRLEAAKEKHGEYISPFDLTSA
ncbi:MAG: phosphoenolpyruvate carboxykinase (GTP) [Sedimentisphaerales bacterium]|nr:phosphoenolpyruvate carboxykinase (GTP) [Sedimentisphaerales bacterium]